MNVYVVLRTEEDAARLLELNGAVSTSRVCRVLLWCSVMCLFVCLFVCVFICLFVVALHVLASDSIRVCDALLCRYWQGTVFALTRRARRP
jgi:hypothetical protein